MQWIGIVDSQLRSFFGREFLASRGTTFNSYLILDERIACIASLRGEHIASLIENIERHVDPVDIDYLVLNQIELNDAPALAAAQIGIAVGSGTDVAAETADIVLVNSNPLDVTALVLFGRATYKKMVQNLIWATGYNLIAIPLAGGVLYGAGIVISPAVGALLMSVSTVIVAINARLLKMKKEDQEDER